MDRKNQTLKSIQRNEQPIHRICSAASKNRETKETSPEIKLNEYRLQMQLNDLMHENMERQEATAHQAI